MDFLSNTLGLTKIPEHILTILYSSLGFTFVHLVFAPWLSLRWFPIAYGSKDRHARNVWVMHAVSQVHVLIIVPLAAYAVLTETPDRELDKAFGWSDTTGLVHGIAAGYFLWDFFDAVINFIDIGFVVHGFACFLVYTMSYRPFVAYYATRCLLWEISTFFLNIHWFLDKTGRTGTTFQFVNGVFLLSSFFGVRLVYGGSVSIRFCLTLLEVWHEIPIFYTIVYMSGNVVLQSLNVIWFLKMIALVRKRLKTPPGERASLLGANGSGADTVGETVHK